MRYSGIIYNDFSAAPGVCLTLFTQGCPFHCKGCHNPETWDFEGGKEFTKETMDSIIRGLQANGVKRNLCIMGGEPLCEENIETVSRIIFSVREALPETKIYVWTGYTYEQLQDMLNTSKHPLSVAIVLSTADVLVDGPYIEEARDITLHMRGSRNQHIWDLKTGELLT